MSPFSSLDQLAAGVIEVLSLVVVDVGGGGHLAGDGVGVEGLMPLGIDGARDAPLGVVLGGGDEFDGAAGTLGIDPIRTDRRLASVRRSDFLFGRRAADHEFDPRIRDDQDRAGI